MKEFLIYKSYMAILNFLLMILGIVVLIILIALAPIMFKNTFNLISIGLVLIIIYAGALVIVKPIVKGKIGEDVTKKVIQSYCHTRGYKSMHDIIVQNTKLVTSQIDHLIITKKGIAVIETKFHAGKIYGTEFSKEWTYVTQGENGSSKNKYSNPVRQNYGHIEALKAILNKDVQFYNIVLYIDNVNLSKCNIKTDFIEVGYTYDLNKIIEKFDQLSKTEISTEEMENIYNIFTSANVTNSIVVKEHIERIHDRIDEKTSNTTPADATTTVASKPVTKAAQTIKNTNPITKY